MKTLPLRDDSTALAEDIGAEARSKLSSALFQARSNVREATTRDERMFEMGQEQALLKIFLVLENIYASWRVNF